MLALKCCKQTSVGCMPFTSAIRHACSARRMRWSRYFIPELSSLEKSTVRHFCAYVTSGSDFVSSPTNLGQLARFVGQQQPTSGDNDLMLQRVDPSSFNERGLYVDGASIFASSVVLLVIMAFSTNRIFRLDHFFASAAQSWKNDMRKRDELKLKRMIGYNDGVNDQEPSKQSPPEDVR
ncbi:hypothetical protein Vretimale_4705 [Volvox reticuliferus]|uniref:Transmembrane protein n=1 Tax=Volvox reticuliferus TaxID=1737510 RepID=A0A8J4C751_9CHLO|nr:hypothetical protein Vretifemale_3307 [Volvox reticuliferus]GIL99566.1 hypothetical protein Vretimale_4705 [Volvox reticuliferus]